MSVWLIAELTLARDAEPTAIRDWLTEGGHAELARAGGRVTGLWDGRGGLGFGSDEVILATAWPDDAVAGAAVELLKAAGSVRAVRGTPLHPTVRPASDDPCDAEGTWVFREFEVEATEVDRFVELSAAAWPAFEERFDATVHGLWRAPDTDAAAAFVLLTRYADLGVWEASRRSGAAPAAWTHFRERRRLTRWSRARAARPLARD